MESYDVMIIGAGQAGGPLATAFAKAGRRTALIEREHAGGTCVNVGCTPTKTMVASARVAYLARRGADYGVRTGPIEIDQTKVRQRKRDIVESFRAGSERGIREGGAAYLEGEATFTGANTLAVRFPSDETRDITAPIIVINTGARPARPNVLGLADLPVLNSTSIMELDVVPEHLLVLGGGYIGVEFGQMFRRFGSRVSIVQRGAQLLTREDDDVADAVAGILREDGIEMLLSTEAVRAERAAGGGIALTVRGPDGSEHALTGSHLLAAAGRVPNTERLNPAAAGITTNARGFIPVNDRLETNVPGIYAVGDVTGGPAFTHISYDDFRILRTNLIEGGDRSTSGRLVPYTVYMDPQLGRVGMSEREAREAGRDVKVAKMPMSHVARALEVDETRGFMKAIVDAQSQRILGAAVLGIEGGELMSMIEIAMMGDLPYTALRDAVFAHPTLAEALNNLFGTL